MFIPPRGALAAAVALSLVLGACGGSDDAATRPAATAGATQVPDTAAPSGPDMTRLAPDDQHSPDSHGPALGVAADGTSAADPVSELRTAMRDLWADHMQWTWSTVVAFGTNPGGLQPQLDRLLANQADIGAAVGGFYGDVAGDQLTDLLTVHINQAVPVLVAAQGGDEAALQVALDDWYANAQDIADFLSAANPTSWPPDATRPALEHHIDSTVAYASDVLAGDFTAAIADYDGAFDHMMMLADTLTDGIVAAFPDQFSS